MSLFRDLCAYRRFGAGQPLLPLAPLLGLTLLVDFQPGLIRSDTGAVASAAGRIIDSD